MGRPPSATSITVRLVIRCPAPPQEQHRIKRMGTPSQQERHAKRQATEPREEARHGTATRQEGGSEEDLMRPAFLRGML